MQCYKCFVCFNLISFVQMHICSPTYRFIRMLGMDHPTTSAMHNLACVLEQLTKAGCSLKFLERCKNRRYIPRFISQKTRHFFNFTQRIDGQVRELQKTLLNHEFNKKRRMMYKFIAKKVVSIRQKKETIHREAPSRLSNIFRMLMQQCNCYNIQAHKSMARKIARLFTPNEIQNNCHQRCTIIG